MGCSDTEYGEEHPQRFVGAWCGVIKPKHSKDRGHAGSGDSRGHQHPGRVRKAAVCMSGALAPKAGATCPLRGVPVRGWSHRQG